MKTSCLNYVIYCQVISEASNYYHIHSNPQVHEKEWKRKEGRKDRRTGSEGEREKETEEAQIKEVNAHFCSYYHLCLVKAAEEGSSVPPESPNVEFSSNLPQHCFTWFLLSHQGTSLNPSLQIRSVKGISDWLRQWSTQNVTYFHTWNSAKASLFSLPLGSLVHNASKPHQYEVSDLRKNENKKTVCNKLQNITHRWSD